MVLPLSSLISVKYLCVLCTLFDFFYLVYIVCLYYFTSVVFFDQHNNFSNLKVKQSPLLVPIFFFHFFNTFHIRVQDNHSFCISVSSPCEIFKKEGKWKSEQQTMKLCWLHRGTVQPILVKNDQPQHDSEYSMSDMYKNFNTCYQQSVLQIVRFR